ncbi:MAG TPA: OmpH family outer membrane protein [Caulobacteraceae bacterium]|jgi:outer membrane protein
MNARSLLVAGLAIGALIANTSATAAPTGGAPAAPPLAQGPVIPGVCVFSVNAIIGNSKVGQAVVARLKVLGGQVNAELQPEADGIRNDGKALEAQQATLDAATLQARKANLDLRASNFEKRAQQRQQEMQATQQKQIGVVLTQLQPVMSALYQEAHCSILIDADSGGVRIVNPAMDLSAKAVAGLDAKITTLTFDREHLDQTPAAAAGAR